MGSSFNGDNTFKVFSREDIQGMTTDEIHQCMAHFKKMIREAKAGGKETHNYEVEYCYLDNECQARSRYEFSGPKGPSRHGNSSRHRYSGDRGKRGRS